MTLTRFHEIESKDFEDIRASMMAYHREQMERWDRSADHAELKRTKMEYRAKAEVHEGMIDFWKSAVFKKP